MMLWNLMPKLADTFFEGSVVCVYFHFWHVLCSRSAPCDGVPAYAWSGLQRPKARRRPCHVHPREGRWPHHALTLCVERYHVICREKIG